jgi:hypothetical protein
LADVTGDGLPEIIVRAGPFLSPPEEVWAIDTLGNPIEGWPLRTRSDLNLWTPLSPTLEDLNGDENPELLLTSFDGRAYAWILGPGESYPWPTYLHDKANSSLYEGPNLPRVREKSVQRAFRISPPRPNPTRGILQMHVEVRERGKISLLVYDVSGRLVSTIYRGFMSPGVHNFRYPLRDRVGKPLPSGIYFLVVSNPNQRRSFPFILLR